MTEVTPMTLTICEAAKYLGLGEKTVRRLTHERRIPHIRAGRLFRYTVEGLQEYLRCEQEQSVAIDLYCPKDNSTHLKAQPQIARRSVIRPVRL